MIDASAERGFSPSRLVVDTGMSALGWSLERARAHLRDEAFQPDTQAATETLRYAADLRRRHWPTSWGSTASSEQPEFVIGVMREAVEIAE